MLSKSSQKGFSLVEISTVLVIIGLIMGTVLTGQSLITSMKMKRTIATWKDIQTATIQFKTKFGAMPGDYGQASKYVNAAAVDGDNNSIIEFNNSLNKNEVINAWSHLASADILRTNQKALTDGALRGPLTGTEFWITTDIASVTNDGYANDNKHYLHMVASRGLSTSDLSNAGHQNAVSYLQADEFDRKYDDGIRNSGFIWYNCTNYIANNKTPECKMQFYISG
jgi:prepilin-type N-terminal cleavage/methylation domain-containing protein